MKTILLNILVITGMASIGFAQPFSDPINIDPNTGNEPYELESGDLDGDGDMDLVMATYDDATANLDFVKWYKNDGDGNFSIEPTISTDITKIDGLAVGNFDNQFGDDIVVTSANQNKLVYFLSDGAGGFTTDASTDIALVGVGEVLTGDINGDGNIDLVSVSYDENKTVWYAGDGAGNFAAEAIVEEGTTKGPYYIDIGDFDGDTDIDVLVGYYNTRSIEIFYNQLIESGTNTVSWIQDAVTVNSVAPAAPYFEVRFADVDNDSNMDVVKLDNGSGIVAWYDKIKDGASTENIISDGTIIARGGKVFVTDLDGDGFNDVIVTDGATADDAIVYFEGNDNAEPDEIPITITDNNWIIYDIAVEDFDSDGDLDIASIGNIPDRLDLYDNQRIDLSTDSFEINEISVSPNPAVNYLKISGFSSERLEVQIFDVVGKEILNTSLVSDASLDVSALESGMYILKIDGQNESLKFMKR